MSSPEPGPTGPLKAAQGRNGDIFSTAFWIAVLLTLAPWFMVQVHQSINADNMCLLVAAQRFLAGGTMVKDFNYPNPPLCFLIYIPPVLLAKYTHLPLYHALFAYSLLMIALSSWAIFRLAAVTGLISRNETLLLLAGFILASTVLTGQFLGEREQYIFLGLFPFVLVQAGLTWRLPLPRRTTAGVLVVGSLAALIKPHFCVIPAAMLLHRMAVQRRWTVIFDKDSLVLMAGVVLYALLLGLVFPDFVTSILPDIVTLYLPVRKDVVVPVAAGVAAFSLLLGFYMLLQPGESRKSVAGLFFLAAIAIIPFWVQGRGYFYHTIPTLGFLICGIFLLAHQAALPVIKRSLPGMETALPLLIFGAFAAIAYTYMPPNAAYPTHDEFRKSGFAALVNECGKPCSFFMFNDTSEIIYPLTAYTGQTYASRFPAYWFLPPIVKAQYALDHGAPSALSRAQVAALRKKYASMVTEDFRRYEPELLIIGEFHVVKDDPRPFDFVTWFSSDPEFPKEWRHYRFVKDMKVDMNEYFGGTVYAQQDHTVSFRIYRRTQK